MADSLTKAVAKATAEAIMLHDSLVRCETPLYRREASRLHYRSLAGEQSCLRRAHLLSKVARGSLALDVKLSSIDTLKTLFPGSPDASIVVLYTAPRHYVVRARVTQALLPARCRNEEHSVVTDPFS